MINNPIICAIDTSDLDAATRLVSKVKPYVGMVKLGLEFFCSYGPHGVKAINNLRVPIFLDLKLHDISNTVAKALKNIVAMDIAVITIHSFGGKQMLTEAAKVVKEQSVQLNKKAPLLMGITVLTSLDKNDLNNLGIEQDVLSQVERLALLSAECGLDGVVCSSQEVAKVKQLCGKDFKTIVPGVRPEGSELGDQKRVMTPKQAINQGADYIVIGRPITQANDPSNACKKILESIG